MTKKLLILAAITLAAITPAKATGYYWYTGSSYWLVGDVDDGDAQGFVSSTSLPTIIRIFNEARRKQQY